MEPTTKEKAWLTRFRRCVSEKPPLLLLHMENCCGDIQAYHGDPHGDYVLLDTPSIRKFLSEGDPLNTPAE